MPYIFCTLGLYFSFWGRWASQYFLINFLCCPSLLAPSPPMKPHSFLTFTVSIAFCTWIWDLQSTSSTTITGLQGWYLLNRVPLFFFFLLWTFWMDSLWYFFILLFFGRHRLFLPWMMMLVGYRNWINYITFSLSSWWWYFKYYK